MNTVSEFHLKVAQDDLEFTMQTLRQFTEAFGALNWAQPKGSAIALLANSVGAHPLKHAISQLAGWIDAYGAGTATWVAWRDAVNDAIQVRRDADALMLDAQEHDNIEWLYAKWISR